MPTQSATDNAYHAVRQTERLVELLGCSDHLIERLPRLLRLSQQELLNLFELMDAEDSPA